MSGNTTAISVTPRGGSSQIRGGPPMASISNSRRLPMLGHFRDVLQVWHSDDQPTDRVSDRVQYTAFSPLLSRCEVSARQDAMTYLVRVRGLLVDGES